MAADDVLPAQRARIDAAAARFAGAAEQARRLFSDTTQRFFDGARMLSARHRHEKKRAFAGVRFAIKRLQIRDFVSATCASLAETFA